ncbi:hypothetical protein [Candidatus Parabeggiatoa sp. HSG14]|uniref:hypothetical protein n=1 Tax=Candidatus Parabeggiatoa sp. HSG14 TaxID=3055593 RepID=UPI0025A7AD55|nr:hypothetical protein [Thiotrichales bacterium HSG14]
MTNQLDITTNQFNLIDFSEASAFINIMPILGTHVELNFWGITLLTSKQRKKPLILPDINLEEPNSNTYIAGFSKIVFHEVVGGEISIELYDPAQTDSFLKNQQNESVILQRQWAFKPKESISVYELDCTSDWPAGACYLAIASKGQVQLTYEVSDCIPTRKFVLEPQKYGQPGWKKAAVAKSDVQRNPSLLKREPEEIKG